MYFLIEEMKCQAKKYNEVFSRDNNTFSEWCVDGIFTATIAF